MAYQRRRSERNRPNMVWCPSKIEKPGTTEGEPLVLGSSQTPINPNQSYLLTTFPLGIADEVNAVLERVRGQIRWQSVNTDPLEGVIYSIVLPKHMLLKSDLSGPIEPGTLMDAAFPRPSYSDGTDDFPLIENACMPSGSSTVSQPVPIDSKAKRKIGKDDVLGVFCEIVGILNTSAIGKTIKVTGLLRALCALRS